MNSQEGSRGAGAFFLRWLSELLAAWSASTVATRECVEPFRVLALTPDFIPLTPSTGYKVKKEGPDRVGPTKDSRMVGDNRRVL